MKKFKPEVDMSTVQICILYQFYSYTLAYRVSGLLNARSFSRFYWPFHSDSNAFVVQLVVSFKDSKHPYIQTYINFIKVSRYLAKS